MSNLRAGVAISHRDQLPSSSRYELLVKIASGGMATVYVGRLSSVAGVSRLVAVKRAHAHLLEDAAFAKMLVAEARLASKIHHPNVVAVHNVEEVEGELLLVMDYVEGAALHELTVPSDVAVRVILDACAGLHAAHELADDDGRPLGIVHRDVSPHNILVGVDGVARLTDFGIAKSSGHTQSDGKTSTGALKGKVAYMAPEYVESGHLDARSDVFALGICAWEALTRRRLFRGASEVDTLRLVLATHVPKDDALPSAVSAVLARALARSPSDRFASAAAFGEALESAAREADLVATHGEVAAFVRKAAGEALAARRALIRDRDETTITRVSRSPHPNADDAPFGRTDATASVPVPADVAPARDLAPTRMMPITRDAPTRSSRPLLAASVFAVGVASVLGVWSATRRDRDVAPVSTEPVAPAVTASPDPSPVVTSAPAEAPVAPSSPVAPARSSAATPPRAHHGTPRPAPMPSAKAVASSPPSAPAPAATGETTTTPALDRAPPNPYAQ